MKRKRTPSPNRNCYFGKPAEFQLSFGLGLRSPPKKSVTGQAGHVMKRRGE